MQDPPVPGVSLPGPISCKPSSSPQDRVLSQPDVTASCVAVGSSPVDPSLAVLRTAIAPASVKGRQAASPPQLHAPSL